MEGEEPCDWDERYDDLGGCWIHKGKPPLPGSECYETSYCVYKRLFSFIGDAAAADIAPRAPLFHICELTWTLVCTILDVWRRGGGLVIE